MQFSGLPWHHSLSDTGTAVNWPVSFYLAGNGKMKNRQYLFKFSNFCISLHVFRRKIIVFCPSMMILIIIAAIFSQIIEKKLGCGWGELPSVCDHLDVISNVLGALRKIQQTLKII